MKYIIYYMNYIICYYPVIINLFCSLDATALTKLSLVFGVHEHAGRLAKASILIQSKEILNGFNYGLTSEQSVLVSYKEVSIMMFSGMFLGDDKCYK